MLQNATEGAKRKQKKPETGHVGFSEMPLSTIRPSPENDKLYRPVDPADPEIIGLADSIRKYRLREPIIITADGFILSGHRRYAACQLAGLDAVPVRVDPIRREDDIDGFVRLLREHNRQRDKTIDEKLREEVVSTDATEAHRRLVEHRQERLRLPTCRAALKLASEGFHVLPVKAKRPLNERGVHGASICPTRIRSWFTRWPDAGVAIACGASGLVVVDVDPPAGEASLEALTDACGQLPDTLTAQTPRGGTHYYFTAPKGVELRPSVGKLGAGVDIRAGASYVVVPPTDGYHVDDIEAELPTREAIASAPDWLAKLVSGPGDNGADDTETTEGHSSAVSAVSAVSVSPDSIVTETVPNGPGQRNELILSLARGLKFEAGLKGQPVEVLKPHVWRWWEMARPNITTEDFDTTWCDFMHSWERARYPLHADIAAAAFARAREAWPGAEGLDLLRLACWELQRTKGKDAEGKPLPWSLSCSQVARLLWGATDPVSRRKANRWLRGLEVEGVLKVVQRGKPGPPGSPATRYLFIGEPRSHESDPR